MKGGDFPGTWNSVLSGTDCRFKDLWEGIPNRFKKEQKGVCGLSRMSEVEIWRRWHQA